MAQAVVFRSVMAIITASDSLATGVSVSCVSSTIAPGSITLRAGNSMVLP